MSDLRHIGAPFDAFITRLNPSRHSTSAGSTPAVVCVRGEIQGLLKNIEKLDCNCFQKNLATKGYDENM